MNDTARRMTFVKHINTIRMALAQIDEMLTGMEEGIEVDSVPAFDPKKGYRCRNPELRVLIHYTDSDGHHYGSIWQDRGPPSSGSWNSAGKYVGSGGRHESWDLVNYDNDAPPSPEPQESATDKDHRKRLDLRMMIDLGNHMVKQVGDRLLVQAWANAIKNIRVQRNSVENRG